MVKLTSSVFRAISLGVFFRDAPSTKAIILSMKDSPGSEVICILSQSLTTVVPPVTDATSPPLSFNTGADSPVIADSSTEATPSMTSPSFGMSSPAFTKTISPFFIILALTVISFPSSLRTRACMSFCVFFRLWACALPRPSATASAKFANSTVTNRMTDTTTLYNPRLFPSSPNIFGKNERKSVTTKPTSTTNMTGFFIMYLGLSFLKAPRIEDLRISPVINFVFVSLLMKVSSLIPQSQMFRNGTKCQHREKCKCGKN